MSYSCSQNIICYLVYNSIEYMYMLSYTLNIFIYYNFSSFFNQGCRNVLGLATKKP